MAAKEIGMSKMLAMNGFQKLHYVGMRPLPMALTGPEKVISGTVKFENLRFHVGVAFLK